MVYSNHKRRLRRRRTVKYGVPRVAKRLTTMKARVIRRKYPQRSRNLMLVRLQGVRAIETNFVEHAVTDVLVSVTTWIRLKTVNLIAQGTSPQERLGIKARMKMLLIHGSFGWGNSVSSGVVHTDVRIVVVLDMQSNGANPIASDIFAQTTSEKSYYSYNNLSSSKRFKKLLDFNLSPKWFSKTADAGTTRLENQNITFRKYVSLLGIETLYSGIGATIGDITSNAISVWICMQSGVSGVSSATQGNVTAQFRVRFLQ